MRRSVALSLVATLAALAACDTGPQDTCSVQVTPRTVTIPVNGSTAVRGQAFDCSGASIGDRRVNFSSENPQVATVSADGLIVGIAIGQTQVRAVSQGQSDAIQVTVTPEPIDRIELVPTAPVLLRPGNPAFTVRANPLNTQNLVIQGRQLTWQSSNNSVATVTAAADTRSAQITPLTVGNTTITVSGDNGRSATLQVNVQARPLGSLRIDPRSATLTETQRRQFTLTLRDSANSVVAPAGRNVTWSSTNAVVASVDGSGLVTAADSGRAQIIALATPENIADTVTVEVVRRRIVEVRVRPVNPTTRLGVPFTFTAQLFDSIGNQITNRVVTWRSINTNLASITPGGIATGLALGTARIVASSEGVADTTQMTITPVPVASVEVTPRSPNLLVGQTLQLGTVVRDSLDREVQGREIVWTSSDPVRMTVSSTGLVRALADGSVTITATARENGRNGSQTVLILPVPINRLRVLPIPIDTFPFPVDTGKTLTFQVDPLDSAGNVLNGRTIRVSSSNPNVASAELSGNTLTIRARNITETITVTLQGVN
nr:Ig-like domain-containing protein [Gemmatimonadaceae bacterium]